MKLAKQLHPDIKVDDTKTKSKEQISLDGQAFIEITKAYKYLKGLS